MSKEYLTKLLHENGKNRYDKNRPPIDPSTWPAEWTTRYYKEYSRFPSIPLPEVRRDSDLLSLITNRKSNRAFSGTGLSLEEISFLLRYSCGQFTHSLNGKEEIHRAYPSGGARYPTEMYVILRASKDENLKPGVYHYNVKGHALEFLWEEKESRTRRSLLVRDEWAERASALFVMTSVFWRSQNKYKDRGYRFLCIEIGAIVQNFYLLCDMLKLPHVGYGGTNDDEIEKLLALNAETESVITTLLVG